MVNDLWMVVEIFNREILQKMLVDGHAAAVRLANQWYHKHYEEAVALAGYEQATCETNSAWMTYANGKGYDVHVLEVV